MKKGIVVEKEYKQGHEPGSGALYIPILGDLFPKLFGQRMKPVDRWFVIAEVDNVMYKYELEKELYNKISIGDKVEIQTDIYGMPEVVPV